MSSVAIPLENITTSDLIQELLKRQCEVLSQYSTSALASGFFGRDDCAEHFDPHYLAYMVENKEHIPDCYLLLKADNLHDQQVLYDLHETFKMMTV